MNQTIEPISKDSIEVEDDKKEYLNKVILSMVSALAKDEPVKQRRVILLTVFEESEGQINQGTKIDLEIARQKYSLKNKGYASIKELRRAEMDRQPKCASQKGFGKFLIFI